MAFSDTLSELGVEIGGESGIISFSFLGDIIIFAFLGCFAAGFTYWYTNKKSYNKTIVKFREINGMTRRVGMEKAKEITLEGTSVRAYYLKKSKFFIPRPSIESAENEFWYFIRNDGEWLNIGMENVNEKMDTLGLKFDHTDMRMANAALKRLVDKSYKKSNFLKEWAPYIGFAVIILMVGISGYLVIGEASKVVGAAAGNIETLNEITKTMNDILSNMNNIASSSGVRTAG